MFCFTSFLASTQYCKVAHNVLLFEVRIFDHNLHYSTKRVLLGTALFLRVLFPRSLFRRISNRLHLTNYGILRNPALFDHSLFDHRKFGHNTIWPQFHYTWSKNFTQRH